MEDFSSNNRALMTIVILRRDNVAVITAPRVVYVICQAKSLKEHDHDLGPLAQHLNTTQNNFTPL